MGKGENRDGVRGKEDYRRIYIKRMRARDQKGQRERERVREQE